MAATYKRSKNLTWKDYVLRYVMIIIGAAVYTFGLVVFLVPNHFFDGRVVGISLIGATLSG